MAQFSRSLQNSVALLGLQNRPSNTYVAVSAGLPSPACFPETLIPEIMNEWWDRDSEKLVTCTEDTSVTPISYGGAVTAAGESLMRLRVPALADELRAQLSPAARVVAFSLKARSAAPLAGRHPDAVAWFDDTGAWVTSSAFSTAPVPEVADFVRRHPVDNDFGKTWDRALPKSAYLFEDPAIGVGALKVG